MLSTFTSPLECDYFRDQTIWDPDGGSEETDLDVICSNCNQHCEGTIFFCATCSHRMFTVFCSSCTEDNECQCEKIFCDNCDRCCDVCGTSVCEDCSRKVDGNKCKPIIREKVDVPFVKCDTCAAETSDSSSSEDENNYSSDDETEEADQKHNNDEEETTDSEEEDNFEFHKFCNQLGPSSYCSFSSPQYFIYDRNRILAGYSEAAIVRKYFECLSNEHDELESEATRQVWKRHKKENFPDTVTNIYAHVQDVAKEIPLEDVYSDL